MDEVYDLCGGAVVVCGLVEGDFFPAEETSRGEKVVDVF